MLQILIGLVTLLLGAEALVRGASKLATAAGISSLVVGLTVVAFGTSAPELAVSVIAGARGQAGLALGNVVGSNIFNILLILGVAAIVKPLTVSEQMVRLDVPMMILASSLVPIAALDGRIGRFEGLAFLALAAIYTYTLLRLGHRKVGPGAEAAKPGREPEPEPMREPGPEPEPTPEPRVRIGPLILLVAAGLAMLVVGSRWLVNGAVDMATALGVSDRVIGLTIVAAGTSMPELATSVVASLRGEREIAVGNLVGSNIFNILWILGVGSVIGSGMSVPLEMMQFDIPVMVGAAIVCLPIFFTGCRVGRREGALLVMFYAAYVTDIILAATGHPGFGTFRVAMFMFVAPLTVLGLGVSAGISFRRRRR